MKQLHQRPRVMVVGTGGTIASKASQAVDYVNYEISSTVEQVLSSIPELGQLADFNTRQPINIESSKINNDDLLKIARTVDSAAKDPEINGVIVIHGTDTLEETAFFLHLVVKTEKPIIVVGAMRPASSLSADGPLNLYNSVIVATSDKVIGKGVLVVANNHIFSARDVAKLDTSSIDAIGGSKYGIIGEVCGGEVRLTHAPLGLHTINSELDLSKISELATVDILFDHQSAGKHLYEAALASGVRAIIVAGMGNGNLSAGARYGAQLSHEAGVPFIRSSRTGQGIVSPVISDDELDIIAAGSLTPQKARILASACIASNNDLFKLKSIFNSY